MSISLYEASVAGFLQTLTGVEGFLARGVAHFADKGIDPEDIVETRLYPDMLPFRFQLVSVAHHSLGAIEGARRGVFSPRIEMPDLGFAGLQAMVGEARATLAGIEPAEIDALQGKDVLFEFGQMKLPFTAEGFLLSFSLPNLHFHATTAYDILRMKGVPIGKRDYTGPLRLKG